MTLLLACALTMANVAIAGPAAPHPLPIKEAVFFGDSLTDAGSFGIRFGTDPGLTWAQIVAMHFGQNALPNEHLDSYRLAQKGYHGIAGPGGLNYAEGGARAAKPYSLTSQDPEGMPIAAQVQVERFLKQHGSFRSDQLVALYIGTNDIALDCDPAINPSLARDLRNGVQPSFGVLSAERDRVEEAARDTARIATTILSHGAKRLVVFTVMDQGVLPWYRSKTIQDFVTDLGRRFNRELVRHLPKNQAILVINVQEFIDDLIRNAASYGFKHGANEDACRELDQDYCEPDMLRSEGAERTYIFAGSEHFTTRANELLAAFVLKRVASSDIR